MGFNSRSYSVQHNSIRMDSKLVYPAVLLLLCLIHAGSSLRCFQCNSFNNDTCGDPFFWRWEQFKESQGTILPKRMSHRYKILLQENLSECSWRGASDP